MGPNPKIDNFISARYGFDIRLLLLSLMAFLLHPGLLNGQSSEPPKTIIESVVANERQAELHRGYFSYTSEERSERTKGHQWTEQVVESADGKIRRLIAEDGMPLGAERSLETNRLRSLAEHSTAVLKKNSPIKKTRTACNASLRSCRKPSSLKTVAWTERSGEFSFIPIRIFLRVL